MELGQYTPMGVYDAYSWLLVNEYAVPMSEVLEIDTQRVEALGYRLIPEHFSTYWKLLGGIKLSVARPGCGEKTRDFDHDEVPYDVEKRIAWGDEAVSAVIWNSDYPWRI